MSILDELRRTMEESNPTLRQSFTGRMAEWFGELLLCAWYMFGIIFYVKVIIFLLTKVR